jgi:hypothetical protein
MGVAARTMIRDIFAISSPLEATSVRSFASSIDMKTHLILTPNAGRLGDDGARL